MKFKIEKSYFIVYDSILECYDVIERVHVCNNYYREHTKFTGFECFIDARDYCMNYGINKNRIFKIK